MRLERLLRGAYKRGSGIQTAQKRQLDLEKQAAKQLKYGHCLSVSVAAT